MLSTGINIQSSVGRYSQADPVNEVVSISEIGLWLGEKFPVEAKEYAKVFSDMRMATMEDLKLIHANRKLFEVLLEKLTKDAGFMINAKAQRRLGDETDALFHAWWWEWLGYPPIYLKYVQAVHSQIKQVDRQTLAAKALAGNVQALKDLLRVLSVSDSDVESLQLRAGPDGEHSCRHAPELVIGQA